MSVPAHVVADLDRFVAEMNAMRLMKSLPPIQKRDVRRANRKLDRARSTPAPRPA